MLTELGFKRFRYNDFLEMREAQARELFGEDVNLTERSPLGKFIRLIAYSEAEQNELAEDVYYSAQVEKATGLSLDAAVKYAGITRIQAKKAMGRRVKVNLNAGGQIPRGSIVGTKDNIKFITLNDVTSNTQGDYYVDIEALEFGEIGNVPANTITEIFTPIPGWNSVTNEQQTIGGQNYETDTQLKTRYFNGGLSVKGSATVPSIRAKLMDEVEGVRVAIALENVELETNSDGIPGKSVYCIVLGGEKEDIARKIFETKAGGIRAFGTTVVDVVDEMGEVHKIGFDYSTEKQIYVNVELEIKDNFPVDGINLVKLEIIKYIGGYDPNNAIYTGLSMGQTVVHVKVVNAALKVEGIEDVKVTLSTDGENFDENNITTIRSETAQTNFTNVVVNYV